MNAASGRGRSVIVEGLPSESRKTLDDHGATGTDAAGLGTWQLSARCGGQSRSGSSTLSCLAWKQKCSAG
jgi:undecaprenyl pyrophosphate phosphatase UppP